MLYCEENLIYDYKELISLIRKYFSTNGDFADAINISERSLSLKLNNKRPWSQLQIDKAVEVLKIPENEIGLYFFTKKVQLV